MDYICDFCGKIVGSPGGLKRHITIKHRQPVAVDIDKRLLALETANHGLENSIVELIKVMGKHWLGLGEEIQAEAEASYKRDNQLLEELNVISRDSIKLDQDILEITDGLQKAIDGFQKAYEQSAKSVNTEQVVSRVLKVRAEK